MELATVKLNSEKAKPEKADAKFMKALEAKNVRQRDRLAVLDKKFDKINKSNVVAVNAYITFEYEEGLLRCLREYPDSFFAWAFQPERLRLSEDERVHVVRAPEPSDILWENLELSKGGRACRNLVTAIGSLIVVCVCAGMIAAIQDAQRTQSRLFPTVDCSLIKPKDLMNVTLVEWDQYPSNFPRSNITGAGHYGRLDCYCRSLLFSGGLTQLLNQVFYPTSDHSGPGQKWCATWLAAFTEMEGLTYGSAIVIVLINLLLRVVLDLLVAFERPRSKTDELVSRAQKLFIVQLINTCVLRDVCESVVVRFVYTVYIVVVVPSFP